MIFDPQNPEKGAEKLLKWAWDGLAFREQVPLPADLTIASVSEFLEHMDFVGEGLGFPLHFGLVAVAKHELSEGDYDSVRACLSKSVDLTDGVLRQNETYFHALIAIGLATDSSLFEWVENRGNLKESEILPLFRFCYSLGNEDLICEIRVRFPDIADDLKAPLLKLHKPSLSFPASEIAKLEPLEGYESGEAGKLVTELMTAMVEDRMEDADRIASRATNPINKCLLLLNLIRGSRLSERNAKRIGGWLEQVETLLDEIEPSARSYDEFVEGRGYLEKIYRIEAYGHHGGDDASRGYELHLLKQYEEALAQNVDYYEREGVLGALCEFLVASGQYEKVIPHLQGLGPKDSLLEVVGRLFRHWDSGKDVPILLELTRKERLAKDEDGGVEDYEVRVFLDRMVQQLGGEGNSDSDTLAETVADHLLTEFEDSSGRESLATAFLERGDYEKASEFGGGKPFSYGASYGDRSVDYLRAVRGWERDPEILTHFALKGHPREAVQHLLSAIVKTRTAEWLHREYYSDKPDYPREYLPLCEWAMDEAKDRIALERKGTGGAPATGLGFRLFRLVIGGMVRVVKSIEGRAESTVKESRKERDQRKVRDLEQKLALKLEEAAGISDREDRWRILRDLPDKCRFVNRHWGDQYIDQSSLSAALRAEIPVMRSDELEMDPYRASSEWAQLARALLESFDVEGACEAWREHGKHAPVPPLSSEPLARQASVENWHQVAPFCVTNPRSASLLAAKLFCWYPREKIPYPRKVGF